MKAKIKFGQFIITKARPIIENMPIFGTSFVYYQYYDKPVYGIFKVQPYKNRDWVAPIEYKVKLVPVGSNAKMFNVDDYYTYDINVDENMVFDDISSAQNCLDKILINQ